MLFAHIEQVGPRVHPRAQYALQHAVAHEKRLELEVGRHHEIGEREIGRASQNLVGLEDKRLAIHVELNPALGAESHNIHLQPRDRGSHQHLHIVDEHQVVVGVVEREFSLGMSGNRHIIQIFILGGLVHLFCLFLPQK